MEEARRMVQLHWPRAEEVQRPMQDSKGALQEFLQRDGGEAPTYRIIGQDGPPHDRRFTAQVLRDQQPLPREPAAPRSRLSKQPRWPRSRRCKHPSKAKRTAGKQLPKEAPLPCIFLPWRTKNQSIFMPGYTVLTPSKRHWKASISAFAVCCG